MQMTRKELLTSPEYWQEAIEIKCFQEGISKEDIRLKVIKTTKKAQTFEDWVKWWWK